MSPLTAAQPRSPLVDRPGYHTRLSTSNTHLAMCTGTFQPFLEILAFDVIGRPIANCRSEEFSAVRAMRNSCSEIHRGLCTSSEPEIWSGTCGARHTLPSVK